MHPSTEIQKAPGTSNAGRNGKGERLAVVNGSLLTAAQVAQMLGVPKSWVYEQSRKGRIPTVTLGRYRRYRAEAITNWVETLEAGKEKLG
jgi:excisionase family DNA binding protein